MKNYQKVFFIFLLSLLVLIWITYFSIQKFTPPVERDFKKTATIVDIHSHVACFGYKSPCYFAKRLREGIRFESYKYIFDVDESQAKKNGDEYIIDQITSKVRASKYVDKVVLLALDQVYDDQGQVQKDQTEFYVSNSWLAAQVKKHDELLFGASVHPFRPDALERLEWAKTNGAILIKLLPAIQLFHADDPKLNSYYQKLVELDLPLLIHLDDESSFSHDSKQYSDPMKIEPALKLGVRVVVAHAATRGQRDGQDNLDRLVFLLGKYPNLMFDFSALTLAATRYAGLTKVLDNSKIQKRALYGSDYPLSHRLLSSPLFFIFKIGLIKALQLNSIDNPWDRDVLLKRVLGFDQQSFYRTAKYLGLE